MMVSDGIQALVERWETWELHREIKGCFYSHNFVLLYQKYSGGSILHPLSHLIY